MILNGGNWVSGIRPGINNVVPHPPKPRAVEAVAGEPYEGYDGNLTQNGKGGPGLVGQPMPEEFVIMINGVNLVDIIAALQAPATP